MKQRFQPKRAAIIRAIGEKNARVLLAARELKRAGEKLYAHLIARLDVAAATDAPMPVFEGLAEMHTALCRANGTNEPLPKRLRQKPKAESQIETANARALARLAAVTSAVRRHFPTEAK